MTDGLNVSRLIARILAQYAALGELGKGPLRSHLQTALRRHGSLPRGTTPTANVLLAALTAWNACYDRSGALTTSADVAVRCGQDTGVAERAMLARLDAHDGNPRSAP